MEPVASTDGLAWLQYWNNGVTIYKSIMSATLSSHCQADDHSHSLMSGKPGSNTEHCIYSTFID